MGLDVTLVPRLARGVRLRRDRISGKLFLLRPETGFELTGSAGEVMKLCQGQLTVAEIVDRLAESHRDAARHLILEDIAVLLSELAQQGVLEMGAKQ